MDDFLVEPQNQGRAGTTWEPSHEWRLAEATPSSRGFRWFSRKPLGSLVDPQSQDRKTEDGAAAAPDRSDPRVLFIPSCPGYTGLTGALDRSDRCGSLVGFASGELLDSCVFGSWWCWSVLGPFGVVLLDFV
jgi:hypothetical protein